MSIHIGAKPGQIADAVLLPGDPLRAQWIAQTYLDDVEPYSTVRNMLGFTGTYNGRLISVQGSGMGQPSLAIYVNELIREYDVRTLVRVGSAGALSSRLALRDVVLAMSASTDSAMNRIRFEGLDYAPTADFHLLRTAYDTARERGIDVHVGQVFSGDSFYHDRPELVQRMADYGALAIEMEASALYTLAAKHDRQALAILTISDHIVTGEETPAQERESGFGAMAELALETVTR
ncbi:MAG TPA: purine-nucleoside phosphorylase [Actinopolymorphaceae bacterium]